MAVKRNKCYLFVCFVLFLKYGIDLTEYVGVECTKTEFEDPGRQHLTSEAGRGDI